MVKISCAGSREHITCCTLCPKTGPKPCATFLCSIKINSVSATDVVPHLSTDMTKFHPWCLCDLSDITLFWEPPLHLEHSLGSSAGSRKVPNIHLSHS